MQHCEQNVTSQSVPQERGIEITGGPSGEKTEDGDASDLCDQQKARSNREDNQAEVRGKDETEKRNRTSRKPGIIAQDVGGKA